MNILGIFIYNSTRNAWLQEDEKSWGPLDSAVQFTEGNEGTAQGIRERETKNDDTTYVMVCI